MFFSVHQRHFSLQQKDIVTENHNQELYNQVALDTFTT